MSLINKYLQLASERKASDLHIAGNEVPAIRFDGQLIRLTDEPKLKPDELIKELKEMLRPEQWKEFETTRDLDLSYEVGETRYRVNCHWHRGLPGLTARIVAGEIPTMEEVAMPAVVYQMIRQHQGLILLTGATGNGKSTNMAAMINLINEERALNIITLEDPIEFIHSSKKSIIIQREMGSDMQSFTEALKHIVRQDPDVIMVGEMRDLETIAATITLAETGHLVLATLHTFNAPQTIDRIIDSFSPYQQAQIRLQLSLTLIGIISQRLIAKKGGGRLPAREILVNNSAVANCIRDNKIHMLRSIIQTGSKEGMFTMDQDLRALYQQGLITREVALAYMNFPEEL